MAWHIKGTPQRREILAEALRWVSSFQGLSTDAYLARHRQDSDIVGLKGYFTSVIDWIGSVFIRSPDKEMRGLEWGRLYETYHSNSYSAAALDAGVDALLADPAVSKPKELYEYVLGGKTDPQLLASRLLDEKTKTLAYQRQTKEAKEEGSSNCPLCAVGNNPNKTRIYQQKEMDADHVTAWSKDGNTDLKNCQMLCATHNRAKAIAE